MKSPSVRWWIVFCTSVFIILFAMFNGVGNLIIERDATHLSWLVLSFFFVGSMHLGYYIRRKHYSIRSGNYSDRDFKVTDYFIQTCTGVGMLGTIIGLMISMISSFDGINTSDPESIKTALSMFASGMGAALTTTLVGLSCALMLEAQLIAVKGKWRA